MVRPSSIFISLTKANQYNCQTDNLIDKQIDKATKEQLSSSCLYTIIFR